MLCLLYHDRPAAPVRAVRSIGAWGAWAAWALTASLSAACGSAATPPAASGTATPITAAATPNTPTAEAIARGRASIERIRMAAGGATVASVTGLRASGASQLSMMKVPRRLKIDLRLPESYRQEESMQGGFSTVFGLEQGTGYLLGADLGGEGRSTDLAVAQRARTRVARQAMFAFLAGVCPSCLIGTGVVTPTDGGTVTAGDDEGAAIVLLDGPDGRIGRLVVDPDTWLVRRFIQPPQTATGGVAAASDTTFTFSDFKAVGGMQVPHTVVRVSGPIRSTWTIDSWTINPKFGANDFSPSRR